MGPSLGKIRTIPWIFLLFISYQLIKILCFYFDSLYMVCMVCMVCKILVYFRFTASKIKSLAKNILKMKWTNDEMDDSMDEKLGKRHVEPRKFFLKNRLFQLLTLSFTNSAHELLNELSPRSLGPR